MFNHRLIIAICLFMTINCENPIGEFPYIKKLDNYRFILISSKGISFFDPTLTNAKPVITFEEGETFGYDDSYSSKAAQFPREDGDLIMALAKDILYIFDSDETLLNQTNFISDYEFKRFYNIYPYKKVENTFTALLVYVDDSDLGNIYLNFKKIIYDADTNLISFSGLTTYLMDTYDEFEQDVEVYGSSPCALLEYNGSKIVNCFYSIFGNFKIVNFDPENNFSEDIKLTYNANKDIGSNFFKAITLPGNEKVIYCSFYQNLIECIEYDITTNTFKSFMNITHDFLIVLEYTCDAVYFEESEQIVLLLLGPGDGSSTSDFKIAVIVSNLLGEYTKFDFLNVESVSVGDLSLRTDLVIPLDKLTYHIVGYKSDIETFSFDLEIPFDLKCKYYYNYPRTSCLEIIPEGFFCNDTENKAIDKCHEDCQTCEKAPTESNSNCLTCRNISFFFDLGNCRENCPNGYFMDEIYNLTCKCTNNIACFLCSENNLCLSCNFEMGYYPKSDEEINGDFINCYKEPDGYYFDNDKYYPCYSTCKKCDVLGNELDNKCIECMTGYEFKTDFENDKNCYKKCSYYYYFDENKNYFCTETEECPEEYRELIPEQKKCIKRNNSECEINDYLESKCNISLSPSELIPQISSYITNSENIDLLMQIIDNDKYIIKPLNNSILELISLDNQEISDDPGISIIELNECKDILNQVYGIENASLLLYKIDTQIEGYSTLSVNYELYNPNNFSKLNLDYCNQSFIYIKIPALINPEETYKYDPKSDYYNDMCFPYTNENEADVLIKDRKNEFINNNMSLCENNCEFKGYDSENKKAICKCKIKNLIEELTDIDIDSEKFFEGWIDIDNLINIKVVKCYKLLSTKNGFLKNIGNFILLSIILLFIASAIYFYLKGFPKLQKEIFDLKQEKIQEKIAEIKIEEQDLTKKDISVFKSENTKKRVKVKRRKSKKRSVQLSNSKKMSTINANEEIKNNVNLLSSKILMNKNTININNDNDNDNKNEKNLNQEPEKKEEKFIKEFKDLNDYEINSLDYQDAIEIDKRSYVQYYWSLIKTKHLLVFTFYPTKDYNSYIIKIELFLFAFALYLTVNALFFTDDTIHKIYEDEGIFNFIYHFPQIIYSTIISAVINIIVKKLSLTEKQIVELKGEKNSIDFDSKILKLVKYLRLKFILFYIISGIFLLFFWFYLSCFCAVYRNTQNHLIKDTLLSFTLSLLYPFVLNLLPIVIRIPAIKSRDKELVYKISKIIQII